MSTIPVSEFEHRVARWIEHVEKTREPLEISQRGKSKIVVIDKQTFDQWKSEWKADREKLQAIEIRLLVEAGERAFQQGQYMTHEEVGRKLGLITRRRKRRS